MAINKVEFGNQTLIDLTGDTATPEDVLGGKTFHTKSGEASVGTAGPYAGSATNGGPATTAKKLFGQDTRSVNSPPSFYLASGQNSTLVTEFKNRAVIDAPGSSNFGTLITVTPWMDSSGGLPVQTYVDNTGQKAIRFAQTSETWGSWSTLASNSDIPSVGNGTIKLQRNGVDIMTFTTNQNSNVTGNLIIPTKVSELTNDSEFISDDDPRLTDSRNAKDVYAWAKASTKPSYTASEVGAIATSAKGANGGVAELDSAGKVPSSQLPSFVDDVLEYNSLSNFPTTGETGKIYIAKDTNKTYRWSGTTYVEISASLALGETSFTAYRGDRGKTAYDHSQVTSGNPHNVTKSDVGLGNVGNFKAVSTVASQGLTDTEKSNARANIGAGTSSFSGSYNDLTNKPTIPTVNNATLTIQKNGTNVQTFTANQSTNATANITVPTKVSDLTNDSKFVADNPSFTEASSRANIATGETFSTILGKIKKFFTDLKTVAFTGSYNDLTNKPTIPAAQVNSDWNAASGVAQILNKPTIPTVNNATLTIQKNGTTVKTFTANASSNVTANITVPTKVSELTNDSGYTTNTGTVTSVAAGTGLSGGTITSSGTISLANHSANYLSGGYLNIHPENDPTLIPFMNNDIAYLLKRGGSAIVKYDGTTQSVDLTNCFDASPSYWAINPTNTTTIVIELTLHKAFTWTNTIYVDFGAAGWRAKNVKIEVMNSNYAQDVWTQKYSNTNNGLGHCYVVTSHTPVGASNAGGGFNKVRFTFSSWNNATIFRIAQMGIYNYGSAGLRETFLPKDGGNVYGTIYPNSNNGANLGTTSNYWNNAYITNINGVAVGSSPKFTDTTYNFSGTTFYSGNKDNAEHNANNAIKNGNYYYTSNGPATSLGASTADGALYVQSYNDTWVGQIAQDYRNGGLYVRGKNNGSWQSWYKVWDSRNLTNLNQLTNGPGYITGITKSMVTTALGYTPPTSDTNNAVTQTATTTSADYEVLFSATADNTTRTEGARKNSNLKFNPSTGNLTVTKVNGETVKYTSSVNAVVGDTTCTISDSSITTTSLIEPFSSNSTGDTIAIKNIAVTAGQAVLTFKALTVDTSFRLRITNV